MSAHKHPGQDTGLPLPSPRSPSQLDEKVLAYARAHAPRKRFPLQPAWAAGLATTGVIVLALFITLPQQPVPSVAPEPSGPVMMASPAADTDAESKRALAKAAAKEKPAARIARKDMPAAQMSRSVAVEQEIREEQVMADEAFIQLPPQALGAAATPAQAALNADSAAPGATAPATEPTIQQQLQPYATLLQQGQEAKARAGYQALRASCTDCRLPATLEQALADYPPPEQPFLTP